MNILFIVPYMPNLVRVRSFNLIRQLAERGNQVTVCTLWTDSNERVDGASLEKYSGLELIAVSQSRWRSLWNCLLALPSTVPLQAVFSWQPELADNIEERLKSQDAFKYEVVHVEHLRGAQYGLFVKSRFQHVPVVWDSVDCISYLFKQAARQSRSYYGKLMTRLDLYRTHRYEGWLASQFDRVLFTTAVDRQALLDLVPANVKPSPMDVLPNGVDFEYFSAGEEIERDPTTIVFSGKMGYHANVTMLMFLVREVMPLVWAQKPEVKLRVVGKDPTARVRSLAENPAITVTGTVPDMRPYLRKATLAVVPMVYGAGFQNKVVEAMACSTPVVATPRAILALSAQPGRDLLVAERPDEIAAQILQLVDNPDYRRQLGENGRRYVQQNHSWSGVAEQLEDVYRKAIQALSERGKSTFPDRG